MTYYLIRYEDEVQFGFGGGSSGPADDYVVQRETVETFEEAEKWAAKNYDKEYPPYVIKGEKVEFDFTRTVTVIAKAKA